MFAFSVRSFTLVLLGILPISLIFVAQEKDKKGAGNTSQTEDQAPVPKTNGTIEEGTGIQLESIDSPAEAYAEKLALWREVVKKMFLIRGQFEISSQEEAEEWRVQWRETVAKGNKIMAELKWIALAAYIESPNTDDDLARMLEKFASEAVKIADYEEAYRIAKPMAENRTRYKKIYQHAALSAFATSNYREAKKFFRMAAEQEVYEGYYANMEKDLPRLIKMWDEEESQRLEERKKNDLPRIKFTTNRGEFEIELFEDSAPNSVAGIVYLVENKFYDGLKFFNSDQVSVRFGCPNNAGNGDGGFQIESEINLPKTRQQFRGSVALLSTANGYCGSQMFISKTAKPDNKIHPMVGRVVSGMKIVISIFQPNETNVGEPLDYIVKAEVIRKRDHNYLPKQAE